MFHASYTAVQTTSMPEPHEVYWKLSQWYLSAFQIIQEYPGKEGTYNTKNM